MRSATASLPVRPSRKPSNACSAIVTWASDAIEYEFWRSGSEYYFVIEPAAGVADESVRRLGRRIPQDVPLPDRARLFGLCASSFAAHAPPESTTSRACCAPRCNSAPARTRLVFDRDAIERPLEGGNPELARQNDAIAFIKPVADRT